MANTLSALEPVLFSAAQQVSAEPFGAVDAINAEWNDKGVARGDKVKVTVAPSRETEAFVPGAVTSTGDDAVADAVEVEITKSDKVSWHLTGEQQRSLDNGATSAEWVRQLVAQGMRSLRNAAERDCASAIKVGASRATGSAGQNPFGSGLNALVDVRKILHDNGAPLADLQFVMDTSAGAAVRKLGIVQQADQAGTAEERRSGNLLRQFGFQFRESAGISLHDQGAGANYVTDGTEFGIGERTISLKTGTGAINAGSVIQFSDTDHDDPNLYVINEALSGGDIVIGRPGLRTAVPDETDAELAGDYTPLLAFERDAVVGVMRPPIMPANPTINQIAISDEQGMTYLMLDISQYGQRTWELHLAWGFKVVQGEHVALVLS